jgi:diguanylate cyclase (GGDEF)-like protein/PAS domain S-box-containing protein
MGHPVGEEISDMTVTALPGDDSGDGRGDRDDAGSLPLPMYRALIEQSSDIVTILDADGTWRSSSPAGTRLLGWPSGYDPGPLGIFAILHPDDFPAAEAALQEVRDGSRGPEDAIILRARTTDGAWLSFETRARDLRDDPHVHGIVITARDVTERQEAEAKVALLYEVLEASTELVLICRTDGTVLYTNEVARDRMNLTEGDVAVADLIVDDASAARINTEVVPAVASDNAWTGELTLRTRSGSPLPVAVTIQHHPTGTGADGFISVIAHDISELKQTQAQLEHQATHDALTALPNRALFQELGDQALARANRYGTTVAVLFLDLDRFTPVNDSFGHTAGDDLLVQVSARLRASVRRGDVVARFGGDEFVILCEHPAGQREMRELADRLIRALSEPLTVLGYPAAVGASIGIAIGGGGRVTVDTLIRDADVALYHAKEQGRGRAVLFGE